ncbi:MAG: hypothetical protein RIF36_15545 [Imperialibacter sp.]|uniref:tetratricopeptide repeat protein n=1 Tax=Imperialibacter sp. TaxID=2038411 RepID=UPI0032EBDFA2
MKSTFGLITVLLFVILSPPHTATSQERLPLFSSKSKIKLVQLCVDHIYNMEFDEARVLYKEIKIALPGHPAIDMLDAFFISWQEMPFNVHSPGYKNHIAKLQAVIEKSQKILKEDADNEEGIFFEMSARGLLAEYYADEGSYMKAISEAKQTYDFIKKGFELTDKNPEFLFTVGLYNYFRETYPERHPIYKPFLWFFKSGDKQLGLKQLDQACRQGVLTKVEANLYTSYIYLRYENNPETALKYLRRLNKDYPKNAFFQTKLAEALVMNERYKEVVPLADELLGNSDAYYRMSANLFLGIMEEKKAQNLSDATYYYQKALSESATFEFKGEYYKSLAYLGLGRIFRSQGNSDLADGQFNLAIEWATTEEVEKEAKGYLKH